MPTIAPEFGGATCFPDALRRGADILGIVGLRELSGLAGFWPAFLSASSLASLILGLCFCLFGKILFANLLAIANAKHHDYIVCFLLRQCIARDMPPVEIALAIVAQQPRIEFVLADNANLG